MQALLQDIPGERAGRSQRFEPVSLRIAALRQEDDAELPQGEWEHTLRRADWPGVARLCEEALRDGGKDFQIAAQLCEAWLRGDGLSGLLRGGELMAGMIESFWDDGWPALDAGEPELRRAPFSWLLVNLPVAMVTRLVLLTVPGETDTALTADLMRRLESQADDSETDEPPALTLAQCRRVAMAQAAFGPALLEALQQARAAWLHVEALLDERMGAEAPGFAPLRDAFEQLERCVQALWPQAGQTPEYEAEPASMMVQEVDAVLPGVVSPALIYRPPSREQAYQQLQIIADYLAGIEPHSPTPYLLREAIRWGSMPLDELMRSLAQEEGGLSRLLALLNVN